MTSTSFVSRNLGVVIACVCALAWAAWYGIRLDVREPPNRALAHARAELSACLLGQPSDDPWAIEQRLRGIHVAVRNDASIDDWPTRCATQAEALERLLEEHGAAPDDRAPASERLRDADLYDDLRVAREIVELLRPVGDEPEPLEAAIASSPTPPPPADLMRELAPWPHGPSRATSDAAALVLLLDRAVCRFAATQSGLEPVARCAYLPDRSTDESRVYGLVAGHGLEQVLLTRDGPISSRTGERMMSSTSPHAIALLDEGAFVGLSTDALVVRETAGAERQLVLDRPRGVAAETATLVGGHLLWAEEGTVFVRALAADRLGPVVEVGRPPVASTPFIGPDAHCAHGDAMAAWIESDPASTPRGSEYRIVARLDGTWVLSEPLRGRLDCLPGAAVVTHVRHDDSGTTISRSDCTADGCSTISTFLPNITRRAHAAPLGDRVILVWVDDLVRARIAPLSELPNAPTIPLLDAIGDHRHYEYQGQSFVHRLTLHVRGDSAIVELHGDDTYGIHLSPDAAPQPVHVSYE